jgi:predicted ATPase
MINTLHLRNFKGIRRADIGLERLTVISGPNASGKTSFLEALHFLSRLGTSDPQKLFQGQRDPALLYRRGASDEQMELSCFADKFGIRISVTPPESLPEILLPTSPSPGEWTVRVDGLEAGATPSNWKAISEVPTVARIFRPADLLRLDASTMAIPSRNSWTRVGPNGEALAPALAFIALNQPDDFQRIQDRLRMVVPTIERIRFDRVPIRSNTQSKDKNQFLSVEFEEDFHRIRSSKEIIIFDFKQAKNIPAHLASEGTILVLGLLTVLMGPGRPDLILLDDLERGLHPKAQRELIGLLRTVLDQNPELQIVATTHSPYLVDNLRPEEVRLTNLNEQGTVSVASLIDHPDFEKWKDEMAPGEMWSLFGEKWVSEVAKNSGGE